MSSEFRYMADNLKRSLEVKLLSSGILFRIFSRGKSIDSLDKKIATGKYMEGKLIQDAVGIRVVVYFLDDIEVVNSIIESEYEVQKEDSMIDRPEGDKFSVSRHNLVVSCPKEYISEFKGLIGEGPIDTTFELQIRSVLSEGWHEVEHDLRYKNQSFWSDNDDLSRALNGIVATLETSEWAMKKIFEDMAYRNYKKRSWQAMLVFKLRMRVDNCISDDILVVINKCDDTAKKILRIEREWVVAAFAKAKPSIPVSLNNAIFLWNLYYINTLLSHKLS